MTLNIDRTYWTVDIAFTPAPADEAERDDVVERLLSLTSAGAVYVLGDDVVGTTYCIDGGTWEDAFSLARQHGATLVPEYELIRISLERGGLEAVLL